MTKQEAKKFFQKRPNYPKRYDQTPKGIPKGWRFRLCKNCKTTICTKCKPDGENKIEESGGFLEKDPFNI